jgi:hypothetical protein
MKTKEELLSFVDDSIIPIEIPEWDCSMYIRRMTGAEVTKLNSMHKQKKDATYIMAATCTVGLCDELGIPVFTLADAAALEKKSFAVLDKVSTEIMIHSGCIARKEGEDPEKN